MVKQGSVDRKIEYYKVTADGGDHGLFGEKLHSINDRLSESEREYAFNGTSVNLALIASDLKDNYIRGIISQIRSIAPSKRRLGKNERKPVELEDDEGIDEHTHFIYCPDTSVICIEYNYHGPKIGLLTTIVNKLYEQLDTKAKRNGHMYVQANKAMEKVMHASRIRSVIAQPVDPKTAGKMNSETDLPEVFDNFKAPQETIIQIKMKAKTKGAAALTIDRFKRIFIRNKNDLDYYDKIKVTIEDDITGKAVEYDLIKDKKQDIVNVGLVVGTKEIDTKEIISIMEDKISLFKENNYA